MASRGVEIPVFTDTNLGTHIALAISPEITTGEFKRELESEHLICFPKLGEIRVNALMVKRKSCFYHLPESFPIKHAFKGLKETRFIYMEACPWSSSSKPGLSACVAEKVWGHISNASKVTDSLKPDDCFASTSKNNPKGKRKKRRIKRFHHLKVVLQEVLRAVHLSKKKKKGRKKVKKNCSPNYPVKRLEIGHIDRKEDTASGERFSLFATRTESDHKEEWTPSPLVDTPSEGLSESVSVSGIIKKYFSHYDEVSSSSEVNFAVIQNRPKARAYDNCSNIKINATPRYTVKTRPKMILFPSPAGPDSEYSTDRLKRTEVGNRLVVASNNLGISASKQKPLISLCRFRDGKLLVPKSSTLVRSLVFEISDVDD